MIVIAFLDLFGLGGMYCVCLLLFVGGIGLCLLCIFNSVDVYVFEFVVLYCLVTCLLGLFMLFYCFFYDYFWVCLLWSLRHWFVLCFDRLGCVWLVVIWCGFGVLLLVGRQDILLWFMLDMCLLVKVSFRLGLLYLVCW